MFLLALVAGAAWAAPPKVEVRPAFGDALVEGCRQPVVVTLTNPADGDALNGSVQVSLEDGRSVQPTATFARRVALPRGGGTAQASFVVSVPAGAPPDVVVRVLDGPAGGGDVVTEQRFEGLAVRPESLTLVAVSSSAPDPLAALHAEPLGVYQSDGALRLALPAGSVSRPYLGGTTSTAATPARVLNVAEPALLPDRAAGYGAVGAVYLGDAPPSAFTDAQVSALRGFAVNGGLVVAGAAPRLRADDRFRDLLPTPAAPYAWRDLGRGAVVTLAASPPDGAGQRALWADLLKRAAGPAALGRQLEDGADWTALSFGRSVVHAPGLRAPSPGVVAAFLVGYMALLVPVNFGVLKRLRRPEWAWATVPAVVALASVGAYGVGVAVKGGETLLNVASVVEMGANDGAASVTSAVGLFSPARRGYDVSVTAPDALLGPPESYLGRGRRGGFGGRRRSPGANRTPEAPPVAELTPAGVTARAVAVPQWAMRTLRARTDTLTLGEGIRAELSRKGDQITGTLENRTGRDLWDVTVYGAGGRQTLDVLRAGEKKPVAFTDDPADAGRGRSWEIPLGKFAVPPPGVANDSPEGIRARLNAVITDDVSRAVGTLLTQRRVEDAEDRRLAGLPPRDAVTIAAWNTDPLLPVTVDGRPVPRGAHVNLILATAPVSRPGGRSAGTAAPSAPPPR